MIENWQRKNDQEATPDLPKRLLYDPLTGDGDFQYLPLEERLDALERWAKHDGFVEGRTDAREQYVQLIVKAKDMIREGVACGWCHNGTFHHGSGEGWIPKCINPDPNRHESCPCQSCNATGIKPEYAEFWRTIQEITDEQRMEPGP